jgi:hypothetical protein
MAAQEYEFHIARGELVCHGKDVGSAKIDVEQRQIGHASLEQRNGLPDRARRPHHSVSSFLEQELDIHRDQRFIFDDENGGVIQPRDL